MSRESDRRKINQLRGMVKVLIPAFVALWLWKGTIVRDVSIIAALPPSKSQISVGDSVGIPIFVVGPSDHVELTVREEGQEKEERLTLSAKDEKNSRIRKTTIIARSWPTEGDHTLYIDGKVNTEKPLTLLQEKITISVNKPKPKIVPLPLRILQCETTGSLAEITDSYRSYQINKRIIRGNGTDTFVVVSKKQKYPDYDISKNEITAGADTGTFQLHKCDDCSENSIEPGVLYTFQVVENQPPSMPADTTQSNQIKINIGEDQFVDLNEYVIDHDSSLDTKPALSFEKNSAGQKMKSLLSGKTRFVRKSTDGIWDTLLVTAIYRCTGSSNPEIDLCRSVTLKFNLSFGARPRSVQ